MKVISKNKHDTKREVIIDGKTKHIRLKDGRWWMTLYANCKKCVPVPCSQEEIDD